MNSLNEVRLIGRVGKDPEIKHFDNGGSIAQFTLATTESWKDKEGNKQEKTEWHNIVIPVKGIVGVVEKYVSKGDLLCIGGKLTTRSYEKDGDTKYITEVKGFDMIMLGSKSSSSPNETPSPQTPVAAGEEEDDLPF